MYMAMELSNGYWKLLLGDGVRRCQLSIAAGELLSLNEAVLQARERFGLPTRVPVVSCYEAGRDGFWLHRPKAECARQSWQRIGGASPLRGKV